LREGLFIDNFIIMKKNVSKFKEIDGEYTIIESVFINFKHAGEINF